MVYDGSEALLDDPERLQAGDPSNMLRAVASSASQVREAARVAGESELDSLATEARPRSVVVAGMGGSGITGEVLAALATPSSPIPIVVHRGYGLPAWTGAADLVAAVSCSGRTQETLSAAEEARRRGARLLGVGAPQSPLHDVVSRAGGTYVGIDVGTRMPRASLWSLCVPLLLAADRLGIYQVPLATLEASARMLERVAARCRVDSESFVNPAKALALHLVGGLPMVWGASALAAAGATRFVAQLAENAKYPGIVGVLPEANHNQIVALDGPLASGPADVFLDPVDAAPPPRLKLVVMREAAEHPGVSAQADVAVELAMQRGTPVTQLTAEGDSPLERLASLVALGDFASVYLALALGVDPTPVSAIDTLKSRIGAVRAST